MTRLSDIRRKIDLVKDIEHLTRTMKTISAIRWRMSRNLLQPAVDFRLKLELALELTALHLKKQFSLRKKLALLGIFSDRGLVGGFNQGIAKHMLKFAQEVQSSSKEVCLLILGKQGRNYLVNQGYFISLSQPSKYYPCPSLRTHKEVKPANKEFFVRKGFQLPLSFL